MNIKLNGVRVRSIASAIPERQMDLTELYGIYGMDEVDRIMGLNGIYHVRTAPEEICTSDLCALAARKVMREIDSSQIDGIVFVTQTPDHIMPATSTLLQHRLGLSEDVVAFDINHGCSGYIYGLYQASLLIASGSCRMVLVCVGDVLTPLINPLDRATRMAFGDAGSATLVEQGKGDIAFSIQTKGSGAKQMWIKSGGSRYPSDQNSGMVSVRSDGNMRSDEDLYINGLEIFEHAIREVPRTIESALELSGISRTEVGMFGLHQMSQFVLERLRKVMKLSDAKVPITMANYGNTGSASIPLMLSHIHRQSTQNTKLKKTVLCGFGAGLSSAAAVLDLSQTKFWDPVELSVDGMSA